MIMLLSFCYGFALLSAIYCSYVFFNLAFAMPETLIPYLTQVLDFGFSIIEILMKVVYVLALYASNALGHVVWLVYIVSPYIIKLCSGLFSIGFGIGSEVIHGVLGNSDPTTNILSWVLMLSAGFLYFDSVYRFQKECNNDKDNNEQNINENNRDNDEHNINENNGVNDEHNNIGLYHEDNTGDFMMLPDAVYSEDSSDSYGGNSGFSDDESEQNDLENIENENEANLQHEASHLRMRTARNINTNSRSLQSTAVQDEDGDLCYICYERERNIAVFPCGHVHMCLQCVQMVQQENNLCPVCQGEIEEYKQVFL